MSTIWTLVFSISVLLPVHPDPSSAAVDIPRLKELLLDGHHATSQSQAALLLVQSESPDAASIIHEALRNIDSSDRFIAVAEALRVSRDKRFNTELLGGLAGGKPAVRQAAVTSLASSADEDTILKLQTLTDDKSLEMAARQAALWSIGLSGLQSGAVILLTHLDNEQESIRVTATNALQHLTGQNFGNRVDLWRAWWKGHKDLSRQEWLQERLAYQVSYAQRLESDLEQHKTQIIELHRQLFAHLTVADRIGHIQILSECENPSVRALVATWCSELLRNAETTDKQILADLLLKFSHDSDLEIRRSAVLSLGRVNDARVFDRLCQLSRSNRQAVRAAAMRSLTQQATCAGPEAAIRQRQTVPILQKALADPALEVVVEAAEDLGGLGLPEAGPVLIALLAHSSETVRLAAAQALERIADPTVLADLLTIHDSAVTVRFSIIGALAHAAGDGKTLPEVQRLQLLERLKEIIVRDPDPGVRSRAASVVGVCGNTDSLSFLWQRLQANEDVRVQEKIWGAIQNIIAHGGDLELLMEWDSRLTMGKEFSRRLQLLTETTIAWKKKGFSSAHMALVNEALVEANLQQGHWAAALPVLRDLLSQSANEAEKTKRVQLLLSLGKQAVHDGHAETAFQVAEEAQALLNPASDLSKEFSSLKLEAQKKKLTKSN